MAYEVNITDFGATGNGLTDDTLAIQNALNSGAGSIVVPVGNFKITSTLFLPPYVTMRGIGRLSRLTKNFNGDMLNMGTYSKLYSLELEGKGATFSGRGVVIDTGKYQKITDCTILNTQSYCVEFTEPGAGLVSSIVNSLMYTISLLTVPAIKFPDEEANGDRKIISVECGGGLLADFSGCSTTIVAQCETVGVKFTPNSKKVIFVGNRLAGGTAGINVEIYGREHALVGNVSATPIILKKGTNGVTVSGNTATLIDESEGQNKTDKVLPGVRVTDYYGGISTVASSLIIGAGGSSPNAGSISFGDGTGWGLNIGTKLNDVFDRKFTFFDKGGMYFAPMKAMHSSVGTLFVDIIDHKLKYKDIDGIIRDLY